MFDGRFRFQPESKPCRDEGIIIESGTGVEILLAVRPEVEDAVHEEDGTGGM